eukprot:UN22946
MNILKQNDPKKVVLIFNLDTSKFCTRFAKLTMVPVYEMRFGNVGYNHLISLETLGHTFATFLQSRLSAKVFENSPYEGSYF